MGQYYKAVNPQAQEYLSPHACGDGAKLMEFGQSGGGMMSALAKLLTLSESVRGDWVGAPVVITGDYADEGSFLPPGMSKINLYTAASEPGGHDKDYLRKQKGLTEEELKALPVYRQRDFNEVVGQKTTSSKKAHELSDSTQVFNQPEEIFDQIKYFQTEDIDTALDYLATFMRVSDIPAKLAHGYSYSGSFKSDKASGLVKEWHMQAIERGTKRSTRRVLKFPATAAEVIQFYS